jgi:ankyrin repeat protein
VMPVPCHRLPLHRAAQSGSEECVRLLLTAGARAHNDGADHSILACATSTAMLADLLAAGADPYGPGPLRTTITMSIAENRRISVSERVQMLRALAAAGVDVDERALHATAISSSAMQGNASAVEALLAAGANPRSELNAMAWACFSYSANRNAGIERVIDLLVAAGFDPNERDEQGYRPLHAALSPNEYGDGYRSSDGISVAAAAALIRNGASIDIVFPNFDNYGPLHIAARERSAPALEILLAAGVDPLQRTPAGETPLDVARAVLASDERVLESPPDVPNGLERVDWPKEYASHKNAAAECVRVLEEVTAVAGSPPNETH